MQAKKHSFQTLKVEFPTSISPCFTLSFSQYFIWISPGYVFKSTWILEKNTFLLVTKYQLSNLQLSLFFSQYYSRHPARHIPSFGGAWGGTTSSHLFLFRRGLGRPLFGLGPFLLNNLYIFSPLFFIFPPPPFFPSLCNP